MKYVLYFFPLFITMLSCEAKAQVKADSVLESKILDIVLSLPEVRQANAYVVKHSRHKRHLFDYMGSLPDKKDGDYQVLVAEDNGYIYHTHFIFLVNGKTFAIKFSDTVTGEDIPLEALRKNKKRHKILEYH